MRLPFIFIKYDVVVAHSLRAKNLVFSAFLIPPPEKENIRSSSSARGSFFLSTSSFSLLLSAEGIKKTGIPQNV